MREIEFRGKRTDNGEWVVGGILHYENYTAIVCYSDYQWHEFIEVDPNTVGQHTGLKDKNGTKIYEGDIVYCVSRTDSAKMVVIFEEGEFRMVLCEKYKNYTTGYGYYAIGCFEKEVIGNMHDNPELLPKEAADAES